jgi:hypothetical protein
MSSTAHPVCKVCKKAHGHREPHQWDKEADESGSHADFEVRGLVLEMLGRLVAVEAQLAELREQLREQQAVSVNNPAPIVNSEVHDDVHANVNDVHADRAAYQREYMKKWRASQKAKQ